MTKEEKDIALAELAGTKPYQLEVMIADSTLPDSADPHVVLSVYNERFSRKLQRDVCNLAAATQMDFLDAILFLTGKSKDATSTMQTPSCQL